MLPMRTYNAVLTRHERRMWLHCNPSFAKWWQWRIVSELCETAGRVCAL